MTVAAPAELLPLLVEKGCVAVDGISLTVVSVDDAGFTVSLIPHTLENTDRAGGWTPGTRVNLEGDLVAKYVQRGIAAQLGAAPSVVLTAEGSTMTLCTPEEAVEDIRQGRFVIIVDDEDRENEGDLAIAADRITPEAVNFMATHARGLVCVACEAWRLDELGLSAMVDDNTSQFGTAFTVSVDAVGRGVTTGISAFDRATTIRLICDEHARPGDFAKPGHTFPLRAAPGGVLERAGQTEAIVDLCKAAGRFPAGVICEIMRADGSMARRADLDGFAAEHGLNIVAISDLIAYRRRSERLVVRGATTTLPIDEGVVTIHAYEDVITGATHVALCWGDVSRRRAGAGARAQRVPHRRRLRLAAVRLPRPAGPGHDDHRRGAVAACSSTCARRGGASGCSTSCAPTRSRTAASTPWRPTSTSACRSTSATTASASRSSPTSASSASASSPTTPRSTTASPATASRWWTRCPWWCRPRRTTGATSRPSGPSWATSSTRQQRDAG